MRMLHDQTKEGKFGSADYQELVRRQGVLQPPMLSGREILQCLIGS